MQNILFDDALLLTVKWYLENQVWCEELISKPVIRLM